MYGYVRTGTGYVWVCKGMKMNFTEIPILLGIMFFVSNVNCPHWVPSKSIISNNMNVLVTSNFCRFSTYVGEKLDLGQK